LNGIPTNVRNTKEHQMLSGMASPPFIALNDSKLGISHSVQPLTIEKQDTYLGNATTLLLTQRGA
jgi:hypothetical protein